MANSGYYRNLYRQYADEVRDISNNITTLQNIKNSLTNNFYDEQSNVNREMDELEDDLNKAVRHNGSFTIAASQSCSHKEKATTADEYLDDVVTALENEVASLSDRKSSAERSRDYYHNKYESEKEAERREFLESLQSIFK